MSSPSCMWRDDAPRMPALEYVGLRVSERVREEDHECPLVSFASAGRCLFREAVEYPLEPVWADESCDSRP
jgi:hypothetical protein